MCKISKQLKLCTCNNSEVKAKDVWTYFRIVQGKNLLMVGELVWMKELIPSEKATQKRVLCRMLNNSNCFDFVLKPIEGDVLQIIFEAEEENMVVHNFIFANNKWKSCQIDPLEIMRQRNLHAQGAVVNGLVRGLVMSDFTIKN